MKQKILDIEYNVISIEDAVKKIYDFVNNKLKGAYVVFPNSYDAVLCKKNKPIAEAVNCADLVCPDGMPIIAVMKALGVETQGRCSGPDVMQALLASDSSEESGESRLKHFFYGSTQETLDRLKERLEDKFDGIEISGMYSPPFRPLTDEEDQEIVALINSSGADVLWVGLGCPKQQLWMYEHRDKITIPVMMGVGAAFDFFAQTKPRGPVWMQKTGLEWLFRLLTEPKRMWKRYLVLGPVFIYYALKQIVTRK